MVTLTPTTPLPLVPAGRPPRPSLRSPLQNAEHTCSVFIQYNLSLSLLRATLRIRHMDGRMTEGTVTRRPPFHPIPSTPPPPPLLADKCNKTHRPVRHSPTAGVAVVVVVGASAVSALPPPAARREGRLLRKRNCCCCVVVNDRRESDRDDRLSGEMKMDPIFEGLWSIGKL